MLCFTFATGCRTIKERLFGGRDAAEHIGIGQIMYWSFVPFISIGTCFERESVEYLVIFDTS